MNFERRLEKARLTRYPRPATLDDYTTAAQELEAALRRLPGLVAIYRTGNVSAPGISDLDRIAVVDARRPVPEVWSQLSDRTRYLAMHTPVLVDVETFKVHRFFAHIEPLENVWGEAVALHDERPPSYADVLLGIEGIVVTTLKLMKQAATGRVKIRPILCELHSLRLDLRLTRLNGAVAAEAWALLDDVAAIRRTWFEGTQGESEAALRGILVRTPGQLQRAFEQLAADLQDFQGSTPEVRVWLHRPWTNVSITAAHGHTESFFNAIRRPLLPRTARFSDRVGEIAWRSASFELRLPPQIFSLLLSAEPSWRDFRRRRDDIVRRYQELLAAQRGQFSPLGFASVFPTDPDTRKSPVCAE